MCGAYEFVLHDKCACIWSAEANCEACCVNKVHARAWLAHLPHNPEPLNHAFEPSHPAPTKLQTLNPLLQGTPI